jgi:hypothetical protein
MVVFIGISIAFVSATPIDPSAEYRGDHRLPDPEAIAMMRQS